MAQRTGRPPADRTCHLQACHLRARLGDGGAVVLRPLRGGESQLLDTVFQGLSPRSRQSRYLVPMPRLTSSVRRALADVDGRDHVAWVALIAGVPVGLCRYLRTSPDTAELAFEVVDAEQGRGIASVLVDAVTTVAHANGIVWLEASVAPGNVPSVMLLARVGMSLALRDGLLEGRARLRLMERPRVDRRAVLRLADHEAARRCDEAAGATAS